MRRWALLAMLLAASCPRKDAASDARVAELEKRVALLEERVGAMPGESAGLDAAPFAEIARRLDSKDALERLRAGQALSRRFAESKLDVLNLLKDGTVRQREALAIACSTHATADMAPGLLAALEKSPEPRVRAWLLRSLGRTGSADATAALTSELSHPDESVRIAAVEALGRVGDPRAAAPLALAIGSGDAMIAELAASALASIGDPAAAQLTATWPSQGPRQRRAIVAALARVQGSGIDAFLREKLDDPSALVALESARVLALRGDDSGRELALERLKSEDPSVAQAARAVLDAMESQPAQ